MNMIQLYNRTTQQVVCAFLAAFTVTCFLTLGTVGIESMGPNAYGVITVSEA